jgi:hypothetical protein
MMVFRAMRLIITFLSLLLIAATPLPSGTPPTEQLTAHEQKGNTGAPPPDESGSPGPPLTHGVSGKPSTESGTQPTYNHYCNTASPEWTFATIVQLLSAVAIALFTFGLWQTSIRQWNALRDQVEKADEAIGKADETMRLDQRPWIVPTGDIHLGLGDGTVMTNLPLQFRVDLKNTGKTPALRLEIAMKWVPILWADSHQAPSEDYPDEQRRQLGAIGPGLVHQHWVVSGPVVTPVMHAALFGSAPPPLTGHHPDECLAPPETLLICGEIKYWDQFRREEPHVTKFCFLRLDIGEFVATGPYNECT